MFLNILVQMVQMHIKVGTLTYLSLTYLSRNYYAIFNACDTCGNVMKKTAVRKPTLGNNIAPYLYYCQACEAAKCAACGNTDNVSGRTRKKRKRD